MIRGGTVWRGVLCTSCALPNIRVFAFDNLQSRLRWITFRPLVCSRSRPHNPRPMTACGSLKGDVSAVGLPSHYFRPPVDKLTGSH